MCAVLEKYRCAIRSRGERDWSNAENVRIGARTVKAGGLSFMFALSNYSTPVEKHGNVFGWPRT